MKQFYSALYFTLVDRPNPELMNANIVKRTIRIDNLNLLPRVRKLNSKTVELLINSGRIGALHFFKLN